jgi:hypothetical protein
MPEVREVEVRRRRLNATFERAKRVAPLGDRTELESDYARHLCVLISGFVERAIGEIILAYTDGKSARPVLSFVETATARLRNVDRERLLATVGSLDAVWRAEVEEYVVDERLAALNSIVGLRNDIAHGGGASVSLLQAEKYWIAIQEVIDKVAEVVLADPRPVAPVLARKEGVRRRARRKR